jgi:glutamyl-tRNA synthetase
MIEHFELSDINRAPSVFNTDKLRWINQQYLMTLPLAQIVELVVNRLDNLGIERETDSGLDTIVDLYRQRVSTINELVDSIMYCFQDFGDYDEKAAKKTFKAAAIEPLQLLLKYLAELDDWRPELIHEVIERVTLELDLNMGKVGQPLRVAVTGGSFSPPIDQTVAMIGKERSMRRISKAIETIFAK